MTEKSRMCYDFIHFNTPQLIYSSQSLNNWQTALRKQYFKRDPASNPIGPEPPRPDQHEPERHDDSLKHEEEPDADHKEVEEKQEEDQGSTQGDDAEYPSEKDSTSLHNATRASSVAASHHQGPDEGESLDWTKLPMLSKLDSIHSLIEWQFQNPTRLRQIMKDDDEVALWVRSHLVFILYVLTSGFHIANRTHRL